MRDSSCLAGTFYRQILNYLINLINNERILMTHEEEKLLFGLFSIYLRALQENGEVRDS